MTKNTKKPLNEQVVSRMMKLANLGSLSQNFIKENFEEAKQEETLQKQEESGHAAQSPIKKGPNKTMETVQKEEESLQKEHNLQEVMPEENPEESPMGGEPEMGPGEPDGDEGAPGGGMGEPQVQDLVKAIADAITAQTGVAVDVEGSGAEGGEEPGAEGMPPPPAQAGPPPGGPPGGPPMQETGSKRSEQSTPDDRKPDLARESKQRLKEEFSEAPKVTKQNQSAQGSIKDPTKSEVRVDGVEKPESMGTNSYPHKMKALEEQIYKKVLARLFEDFKKIKSVPKK